MAVRYQTEMCHKVQVRTGDLLHAIGLQVREGRGGTASLEIGTHCQTTAPAFRHCLPLNRFLLLHIFESHRPPPPKIKHFQYKL